MCPDLHSNKLVIRKMMNAIVILLIVCGIITKTSGQLYADDVSDGRCTLNPVAANLTSCLPILFIPKVFTVNLGSKALYRNYAQSFLGRPAANQAELDAMCYTFAFIETIVIQTGYGNKTNIRTVIPTELDPTSPLGPGSPFGLGKFKIETTLAKTSGSTVANQFMTIDQVIWCDQSHVLLVRCVNGTRQDWKVASVGDPAPWALPLAQRIVESLGMPPENAVEYKSVSKGGNCPVVPDLITYGIQAAKNVGLPLPLI